MAIDCTAPRAGCALVALAVSLLACDRDPPCLEHAGRVCAIAGTGELAFNRDGLPPEDTHLFLVSSARRGPDDRIHIMDFNNQRLRVIDDDGLVQTLVGNGFHAIAAEGVPATDSPLENPIDFRFLSDGRLVFVSYHDPRVLVVEADGRLRALAGAADGVLGTVGNEGDGGPPLQALFMQPDGIEVGSDDSIWVSDSLAHRVRLIRGGVIDTVVGTGAAESSGDGGPGVDAAIHWPSALQLDGEGNLYIAETRGHRVRRLAVDGTITTYAGTGIPGREGDGGPATAAQLDQPYGLAWDDDGTLYIADRGNFRVRAVSEDGTIRTIAGTGHEGLTGDGGPADRARFGYVARLAMDGEGLLVADQGNSVVRRITLP